MTRATEHCNHLPGRRSSEPDRHQQLVQHAEAMADYIDQLQVALHLVRDELWSLRVALGQEGKS